MHRSYVENLPLDTEIIFITDEQEIHHIRNVLRLKSSDRIRVFNGAGGEAEGEILRVRKDCVEIKCLSVQKNAEAEGCPKVILACAIPKHAKFEWIIEKAVELGVDEVIPLKTARTEFHMTLERAGKKRERYRTVALNAARQSRRASIPEIHPVCGLSEALACADAATLILIPCLLGERKSLKQAVSGLPAQRIMVLIGPEGDFTKEEVSEAVAAGAVPVTLGRTVLKVETAALSVLAFITLSHAG